VSLVRIFEYLCYSLIARANYRPWLLRLCMIVSQKSQNSNWLAAPLQQVSVRNAAQRFNRRLA